jgi:ferredoxin-NADP reductase
MARAAVPGRLKARRSWRPARLVERRPETSTASTLVLDVPGWPGHQPGQHVDVRLTADDGYQAARSYSLAAPADGDRVEITVQRVPDGEVSSYLADDTQSDDEVEVRGPVGGWFVWNPQQDGRPVLLVAGGSGVVPLMAMIRSRDGARPAPPFRLIYSVRSPDDRIYDQELRRRATADGDLGLTFIYTRTAPDGDARPVGRISADDLSMHGFPPEAEPIVYVCGPTGFVERVSDLLIDLGHDPAKIKTERFGPSGP